MQKLLLMIGLALFALVSNAAEPIKNSAPVTIESIKNARQYAITKQYELEAAKSQSEINKLNAAAEVSTPQPSGFSAPAGNLKLQPIDFSSPNSAAAGDSGMKLMGIYGVGADLTVEIANADRAIIPIKSGEEIDNGWYLKAINDKSVVISKRIAAGKASKKKICSKKGKCRSELISVAAQYKTEVLRISTAMAPANKESAIEKVPSGSGFPTFPALPLPALPRSPK